MPRRRQPPIVRHRRWGRRVSLWLHLSLVSSLFGLPGLDSPSDDFDARALVVVPSVESTPPPAPAVQVVSTPEQVTADMVNERLQETIQQNQQLDRQTQLDRLETLAGRLTEKSSEKSVDELAGKFREWMGTKARATEPAREPPPGPFDYETAQLYDVRRDGTDEAPRYIALLLDADGRVSEEELPPEEGLTAWETFRKLKRFPLAERLYRHITMPLLDKLVRTGQALERSAKQNAPRDNAAPVSTPSVEPLAP